MAITVEASGSQTAVIGTEHTLATIAGPGTYVANIDTANMAAGDAVEFRIKMPVLSGGTARTEFYVMYTGVQPADDVLKTSVPFIVDATAGGCLVTLKQILGTGRVYPWSIKKSL
jgi:hypothetical protein